MWCSVLQFIQNNLQEQNVISLRVRRDSRDRTADLYKIENGTGLFYYSMYLSKSSNTRHIFCCCCYLLLLLFALTFLPKWFYRSQGDLARSATLCDHPQSSSKPQNHLQYSFIKKRYTAVVVFKERESFTSILVKE